MIEQRRQQIIESAIKLFAQNGYHLTSVQDIVEDCGISKGAFYNYFSAKDALHIAIFQYYFDQMSVLFNEIKQTHTDPRKKLHGFLKVHFEQTNKQRELFVVFLREQSFSINDDLRNLMEVTKHRTLIEYEILLNEIYGEEIQPFMSDVILVGEGISNAYIVAMLFHDLPINIDLLPNFIMNRIDDIVAAFLGGEEPIIKQSEALNVFSTDMFKNMNKQDSTTALLNEMLESLETFDLTKKQLNGLTNVITFLKAELTKAEMDVYAFQGMLANLKEIQEFDNYRKKIARIMQVQLL